MSSYGYTRGGAADLSSEIYGVHRETVLLWARALEAALILDGPSCSIDDAELAERLQNLDSFWASLRGHHAKVLWLLDDPEKQAKAKSWIREHADSKGKTKMKVYDFAVHLNKQLLKDEVTDREQDLSDETARVYLHRLGFAVKERKKGINVTVHERADVRDERQQFLNAVDKLIAQEAAAGRPPPVFLYQDESIFLTGDVERTVWVEIGTPAPTTSSSKGKGKGIMVSCFLTRERGLLKDAEFRLEFGKSREGYFDSPKFRDQVCDSRRS